MAAGGTGAHGDDEVDESGLCNLPQAVLPRVPLVHEIVEVRELARLAVAAHVVVLHEVVCVDAHDRLHEPRGALHAALPLHVEHAAEAAQVVVRHLGLLALGHDRLHAARG